MSGAPVTRGFSGLNPYNVLLGSVWPGIAAGASIALDIDMLPFSTDTNNNINLISDHSRVFIDVIIPPAYGTITLDGVPASHFTLQQAYAGRVVYHNTTIDPTAVEYFTLCARYNDNPTILPIHPQFIEGVPSTTPGDEQLGLYYGFMLVGASDAAIWGDVFSTFPAINNSFTVTTTVANSVLTVGIAGWTALAGESPPTAPEVTSISFAGLTFTRLSRQTSVLHMPTASVTRHYMMEVWWALAPTPVSALCTISGTGFTSPGFLLGTVTVFRNLANPAAPFDSNASNFRSLVTSTPPWTGMVMQPDAPELRVLPWFYETLAGNVDCFAGALASDLTNAPRGYGITQWAFEGSDVLHRVGGRGLLYTPVHISFEPSTTATLTTSELVFQDAFVDLSVESNRRKFIATSGTPQWLEPDGSLPFADPAAVYLSTLGPPLDFTQNGGSGGAFPVDGDMDGAAGPGCTVYTVTESAGSAADPQWRLSVSDDGSRTWSRLVKPRSMGPVGHYKTRLRWLKMGQFRQRVMKLESTDPVRKNIIGIYIDLDQGMS